MIVIYTSDNIEHWLLIQSMSIYFKFLYYSARIFFRTNYLNRSLFGFLPDIFIYYSRPSGNFHLEYGRAGEECEASGDEDNQGNKVKKIYGCNRCNDGYGGK